jgi:hypothetical protein
MRSQEPSISERAVCLIIQCHFMSENILREKELLGLLLVVALRCVSHEHLQTLRPEVDADSHDFTLVEDFDGVADKIVDALLQFDRISLQELWDRIIEHCLHLLFLLVRVDFVESDGVIDDLLDVHDLYFRLRLRRDVEARLQVVDAEKDHAVALLNSVQDLCALRPLLQTLDKDVYPHVDRVERLEDLVRDALVSVDDARSFLAFNLQLELDCLVFK